MSVKGFGSQTQHTKGPDIAHEMDKLLDGLDQEMQKLKFLLATSKGQGEIDALLGLPCKSEDPAYKAAYYHSQMATHLASKEEKELLAQMRPVVRNFLKSVST